jgi:hypothetical protein
VLVPTSIGQVKAAAAGGSLSSGGSIAFPIGSIFPLSLELGITGLFPLTPYSVYCYAETLSGTGNSLPQVIATRNNVKTTCCKTVTFNNQPAFVFGDLNQYTTSTIKSTYVFTYSLSSAPSTNIQVIPMINPTNVQAIPSSLTFTSSSPLAGQFFLKAESSLIGGVYAIFLMTKGTDSGQYKNSSIITVTVLASSTPLPPPVMMSSRFSNSGQNVVITFGAATDQAGYVTSFPCNTLFIFTGVSRTTCFWTNSSAVSVSFGVINDNFVYLAIGDSVVLRDSLLKAFCSATSTTCSSNSVALTQSVTTLKPRNPVRPVVIISAPSELGSCGNLSLDATGI